MPGVYPELRGRVAVVTMAASGIGAAVAEAFARQGAIVAVTARRRERLDAVTRRIAAVGGTPLPLEAQVAVQRDAEAAIGAVVSQAGGVDVLVNNATGPDGRAAPLLAASGGRQVWTDRDLTNALLWSRAAGPYLSERRGAIVNVASADGEARPLQAKDRHATGEPAAQGLVGVTRSLARALAPHVRVNCISLGAPASSHRRARRPADADTDRNADGDAGPILGQLALAPSTDPLEPAWPVVFLASDAAAYITGAVLSVHVGRAAR